MSTQVTQQVTEQVSDLLQQEVLAQVQDKTKRVPVIEIFGPTIQGEGEMIGTKTLFLRIGGCDYRCTKCDSLHAVMPIAVKANSTMMTEHEIAQELIILSTKTGTEWVTISGGNPVMWDLYELVMDLHSVGIKIAVETQGSIFRPWVAEVDVLTISPKGPGMVGYKDTEDQFVSFVEQVLSTDEGSVCIPNLCVKIVAFDQQDFEYIVGIDTLINHNEWNDIFTKYISLGNSRPPTLQGVTLQTEAYGLVSDLLADYRNLLEDYFLDRRLKEWRFTPQLHCLVWGNKAGV